MPGRWAFAILAVACVDRSEPMVTEVVAPVVPATLDLGLVAVGERAVGTVLVDNPNTTALILGMDVSPPFLVAGSDDLQIAAGEQSVVEVSWMADTLTEVEGRIRWLDSEGHAVAVTELSARSDEPTLTLYPFEIRFPVTTEAVTDTLLIEVGNLGELPVTMEEIRLESIGSFAIHPPTLPMKLAAQEWVEIVVDYEPEEPGDYYEGRVVIESDDPDSPGWVELIGDGASRVTVTPDPSIAMTQGLGCSEDLELVVGNVGYALAHVTDVTVEGASELSVIDVPPLPWPLVPGNAFEVDVRVSHSVVGPFTGTVTVMSDHSWGPVVAEIVGETVAPEHVVEFVAGTPAQPTAPDVLLVVDRSVSVQDQGLILAGHFDSLIASLDLAPDWRVGILSDASGCLEAIIDSETEDAASVFFDAVSAVPPVPSEALFDLVNLALDRSGHAQCNAGFPDPEHFLHVIVFSDEPEQSGLTWKNQIDDIYVHLASEDQLRISGIVDVDDRCFNGGAGGADGYTEAILESKGLTVDICEDWEDSVSVIGGVSLDNAVRVGLDTPAAPDSLVVTIDGEEVTEGWLYGPTDSSMWFFDPPPEGAHVTIQYREGCP